MERESLIAEGSVERVIESDELRILIERALKGLGIRRGKVLVLPPDRTRAQSRAGEITRILYELLCDCKLDIMPALGTHSTMTHEQLRSMFGEIPVQRFVEHRWREELERLGEVPADFVNQVSEGSVEYSIPIEINRRVIRGGYDLIISVGQVVPHEVVGMANGSKNVLVGAGGQETINRSHYLGAVYGMERIMGRIDTPVRKVYDYADEHYLNHLPLVYIFTVIGRTEEGRLVIRGLFIGDSIQSFRQSAELSQKVNLDLLDEPLERVVVYLNPEEFSSTWLGNKSIYRTRMAIADGGRLLVLAPGLKEFGEDPEIDRLIRRYGYRGTPATKQAVETDEELRANLSAAAHLIHGSSEGRFNITYATDPSKMTKEEIESVGYEWMDISEALRLYNPSKLTNGHQNDFFYISNPALGLWALRSQFDT